MLLGKMKDEDKEKYMHNETYTRNCHYCEKVYNTSTQIPVYNVDNFIVLHQLSKMQVWYFQNWNEIVPCSEHFWSVQHYPTNKNTLFLYHYTDMQSIICMDYTLYIYTLVHVHLCNVWETHETKPKVLT